MNDKHPHRPMDGLVRGGDYKKDGLAKPLHYLPVHCWENGLSMGVSSAKSVMNASIFA